MQKLDPYKNQKRWDFFKDNHFKKTPENVKTSDWKLLIEFLKDMELGLNVPKEKKGKRDSGTLLNLSSHNKFFLQNFKKPLIKLTKQDLHLLENEIQQGKILKRNGQKFSAFGNYIKDFKVFWNWGIRKGKWKENITEDISSKTEKPHWVYLTEGQVKDFFNNLSLDYRVLCWFMYDTGARVTEALNIKVSDFSKDFSQVTISDETAKTFGRTINLKLSTQLVKEWVKMKSLKDNDYFIQGKPFAINKYLRYHCGKVFGKDKISHVKSKGLYGNFTLYDIRHNAVCYWFNRYPTHKGLMYRFGWRKADKIEYYSEFLGVADELSDSDMILAEDKNKVFKLEHELETMRGQIQKLNQFLLSTEAAADLTDIDSGIMVYKIPQRRK